MQNMVATIVVGSLIHSSYWSINGRRVNLINKPAATRPDASDNSMTEAISMTWTAFAILAMFQVAFRSICQMLGNKIYLGPCSNSNHIASSSILERFPNIEKAQRLGPMTAPRSTSLFLTSKSAFGRLSPNCQALLQL